MDGVFTICIVVWFCFYPFVFLCFPYAFFMVCLRWLYIFMLVLCFLSSCCGLVVLSNIRQNTKTLYMSRKYFVNLKRQV